MQILNEVTYLKPRISRDQHPGARRPGTGPVSGRLHGGARLLDAHRDARRTAFRAYLLKGGFVIFDDFAEERGGWAPSSALMRRVLPGGRWVVDLDGTHPIFHSFFEIPDPLIFVPPYDDAGPPVFRGLFEDNDPNKRLMAIDRTSTTTSRSTGNFRAPGFAPIAETNEAYKLGVNYIIYGLDALSSDSDTHS